MSTKARRKKRKIVNRNKCPIRADAAKQVRKNVHRKTKEIIANVVERTSVTTKCIPAGGATPYSDVLINQLFACLTTVMLFGGVRFIEVRTDAEKAAKAVCRNNGTASSARRDHAHDGGFSTTEANTVEKAVLSANQMNKDTTSNKHKRKNCCFYEPFCEPGGTTDGKLINMFFNFLI
jgi:hypothetical protein